MGLVITGVKIEKHMIQMDDSFDKRTRCRKRLITLCFISPFLLLNVCFGMDFGDAPDPIYPTLLANDGARHNPTGPTLGLSRDTEIDGQPDTTATGDDLVGDDDEDGVTLGLLEAGLISAVTIEVQGTSALLDAWIDFNQDGDWSDPNEQVASSSNMTLGNNSIDINVPCDANVGTTFARFRLSTAGGLSPTGLANDGEVEDYQVTILPNEPLIACPQDITLMFDDSAEPYRAPELPIVHFDFNNTTFEVQDISASPQAHNGFQVGNVDFLTGIEGMAANFTPEGCTQLQSHPEINGAPVDDRSISFWFIIDASAPPIRIVVYEEGNANSGISIYVEQASQELHLGVWKSQGLGNGFTGIPGQDYTLLKSGVGTISNDIWYHVALVLDSNAGTAQAYLDEAQVGIDTFGFPLPTHNSGTCLGGMYDGTRFLDNGEAVIGDGNHLNGRMDQFLMYNRALTNEEITGLADIEQVLNSTEAPTAVDSCSTNILLDREDITTAGTSGIVWTIDRTWSALNESGNSSSCMQTIIGFNPFIFENGFEPVSTADQSKPKNH